VEKDDRPAQGLDKQHGDNACPTEEVLPLTYTCDDFATVLEHLTE
jgi:hypothetical protein